MLSQTAEYALRAATFLGRANHFPRKAHEISECTKVPPSYLHKVLAALSRADLVNSKRGPSGGFTLSRPASEISAYEVIQAVDPWKRIVKCPIDDPAHEKELCPLHRHLASTQDSVECAFRKSSIRDLIDRAHLDESRT